MYIVEPKKKNSHALSSYKVRRLIIPLHRQPMRHNVVSKGNTKSPTDKGQHYGTERAVL